MHVALIGKGPGFELAPLKGKGVTTWGANDACGHRECDVVFWMDRCWEKDSLQDKVIKESVNLTKTLIYSTQEWDDIPTSKKYPLEELTDYYGIDFFNDSCCYMLALAIYQGFKRISLYGFNYAWGDMYKEERPGVEFWLGVAIASGITIDIEGELSDLLKTNHQRHAPGLIYAFGTPQTKPRRGIKMGEKVELEPREYTFSVSDRVAIIHMLPQVGTYAVMKAAKRLGEMLWFGDADRSKLNLKKIQDDDGKSFYVWDDQNDIEDITIELDDLEQRIIKGWLDALDREGQIGGEHFGLYEKFCIRE
jgi:hypothetical protein